ncbi:MBL fold metallo-hydrolase [Emticicia agri]|nr:MBL fold metallo-hydrolase [Emticicia agri]
MKKNILIVLVVLIAAVLGGVFYMLSPSGDIEKYQKFYADDTSVPTNGQVKATFFGVSTLLFDDGETQLLIDGFFTRPPFLKLITSALSTDTALIDGLVSRYKMDRVKGIFATHSHYDHAFDVAYDAKKMNATLYGSVSTLNIGRGGGLKEEQLHLFVPYEEIRLGKFTVQIIPSIHSSPSALKDSGVVIKEPIRQPVKMKDYPEGGSFDFLIKHNDHRIYIKPSPNYIEGALDTLKADVCFIGIGTISKKEPAWQNKYYEQTIGKLHPKIVVPLHWDDFTRPIRGSLEMLPRFVANTPKDFDFIIQKTNSDKIDFKLLQAYKSIVLF